MLGRAVEDDHEPDIHVGLLAGGDLGGDGLQIWGGDIPCIRPPNILRSTVIGCEAKYELTKKSLKEEFFVLKSWFLVKKRVIYVMYQISDSRDRQKTDRLESIT